MAIATQEILLFGKWSFDEVTVSDISLRDYITISEGKEVYVPHTAGRYQVRRFRKASCPVVERLTNSLMMHGRNNGKKLMAIRIVQHAFEIINLITDKNPIQVLVDAVMNSGPREDSTRVGSAGTARRQAVDVSPLRRVNQAIYLLTTGVRYPSLVCLRATLLLHITLQLIVRSSAQPRCPHEPRTDGRQARKASFRNIKSIGECLALELINAAKESSNSYAIKTKDQVERVAKSNR